MTAHHGPMPVPARITLALDAISAEGPWVDEALGGAEPMVDQWEAGELVPTAAQIERLAELTGHPAAWFYLPISDALAKPHRVFICERGRRKHGLTVVRSWVDWDGVLHVEEETPPKPPLRPRTPAPAPAAAAIPRPGRPGTHTPVADPDTPGVCGECHLPLDRPNARHRRTP